MATKAHAIGVPINADLTSWGILERIRVSRDLMLTLARRNSLREVDSVFEQWTDQAYLQLGGAHPIRECPSLRPGLVPAQCHSQSM